MATIEGHGLDIRPVAGALGAEILGVDLHDLDDATLAAVRSVLIDHEVVFFRGAHLDDDAHLALAGRLGPLRPFPIRRLLGDDTPGVSAITDGGDVRPQADDWHTDVTWTADPPEFALLRATVVPERGGATLWASMTAAYDALSPPIADLLCRLTVHHDNTSFIAGVVEAMGVETAEELDLPERLRRGYPGVDHPFVRTHPESGRRAILWGGRFMRHVVGLSPVESAGVLDLVERHVSDPRFGCRWDWEVGDLAIWDERSTIHRSAADHWPQHREVRRVEVGGDRPSLDPVG
jgi:taurine dioxygenase